LTTDSFTKKEEASKRVAIRAHLDQKGLPLRFEGENRKNRLKAGELVLYVINRFFGVAGQGARKGRSWMKNVWRTDLSS